MGGDIMIDVILILAIITGLTIVAVRYGRRLLVLTGMALTRAFEESSRIDVDEECLDTSTDDVVTDPAYSNLSCNIYHSIYEN